MCHDNSSHDQTSSTFISGRQGNTDAHITVHNILHTRSFPVTLSDPVLQVGLVHTCSNYLSRWPSQSSHHFLHRWWGRSSQEHKGHLRMITNETLDSCILRSGYVLGRGNISLSNMHISIVTQKLLHRHQRYMYIPEALPCSN